MLGAIATEYMYCGLGAHTLATVHGGSAYAYNFWKVVAEGLVKLGEKVAF